MNTDGSARVLLESLRYNAWFDTVVIHQKPQFKVTADLVSTLFGVYIFHKSLFTFFSMKDNNRIIKVVIRGATCTGAFAAMGRFHRNFMIHAFVGKDLAANQSLCHLDLAHSGLNCFLELSRSFM